MYVAVDDGCGTAIHFSKQLKILRHYENHYFEKPNPSSNSAKVIFMSNLQGLQPVSYNQFIFVEK